MLHFCGVFCRFVFSKQKACSRPSSGDWFTHLRAFHFFVLISSLGLLSVYVLQHFSESEHNVQCTLQNTACYSYHQYTPLTQFLTASTIYERWCMRWIMSPSFPFSYTSPFFNSSVQSSSFCIFTFMNVSQSLMMLHRPPRQCSLCTKKCTKLLIWSLAFILQPNDDLLQLYWHPIGSHLECYYKTDHTWLWYC